MASSSSSSWRDDLHETMKKLISLLTDTDTVFLKEDYNFDQEFLVTFISFLESRSVNNVDGSISKFGAKNQSLVNKSKYRPWDKEDLSGNTSDVFIHRKSTTNLPGGDSRKNKGRIYNILTDYAQVDPSTYQSGLGNILGLNHSQTESTNKHIENLMSSLGFKADAGVAGLSNLAPSSNFLNVTPNSSNFLRSNGTNTGYGVNVNGHKYGTSGLVPPVNSNMYNNRNVTSRATNLVHGVDGSTKKCLDKLRGPDGELPQKLRNIPPHLIENVCNEIMDLDVNVSWDDIGGLHHAKKCVNEMAIMPLLRPDIFKGCRSPGRGLLLFGPPGTGKTMIGKAIAGEAKATFFYISASSVTSKWVGESEQLVRALFGVASCHQPAVIFVDEIDSLLSKRKEGEHECYRRMKTQFFIGMEGFNTGNDQILLIGATNKPQDLDEAARRRFTKRLYIPLPSSEARAWIVKNILEKDGLFKLSTKDIDSISNLTEGYSGSDMKNLVKDAAMGPVREALKQCTDVTKLIKEAIRPVTLKDFEDSLQEVRPSVCLNQLGTYENWNDQFGSLTKSNGNTKKRKTVNNTFFEIPAWINQKPDKRDGQAMNGDQTNHKVDVTNGETDKQYYKEKLEVLKGIYEALQAKNKIDEKKLQLKEKLLESRLEEDLQLKL